MADLNKPTVDSEYTQFPTEIRAAISAALSFLDGEHTNIPLKAKRWNPSTKIFEEYNGAQWVPMATEYKLPVDYNSLKNKPTPNSAVDDESNIKFASSAAVKAAYDKAAEAKTTADDALKRAEEGVNAAKKAQDTANGKQSPATTLAGYGIGNLKVEPFIGDINTLKIDGIYAITQASRSQNLPVSTSCHIQVIAGGDGRWCRQIAYIAYSTDMYERHQTSYQTDSWSPWVKLNDIEPVRQLVAQKANLADFTYQKIGDFEVRKYPDGTMIQSCRVNIPITNRTVIARTLNWALTFVDADLRISATIIYKETNESYRPQALKGNIDTANATVSVIQDSASEFTLVIYDSDVNNAAFFVDIIAIGRWK